MNVVIRVDASINIGIGHVMRCLTLADALRSQGESVQFICRDLLGNKTSYIQERGYIVDVLKFRQAERVSELMDVVPSSDQANLLGVSWQQDAEECKNVLQGLYSDWLLVDHYSLGELWEKEVGEYAAKVMVIDDLANRQHQCDLLLDQTYGCKLSAYQNLTPHGCKLLLGSMYALLHPSFFRLRDNALARRKCFKRITNIMVSMGGTDELNMTPRVLSSLQNVIGSHLFIVDVVLGADSPYLHQVNSFASTANFQVNVLVDVNDMAELMLKADLAIGAGGITSWERCCLGLPTVLIILAENQLLIGENLQDVGATITLDNDLDLEKNIIKSVECLNDSSELYQNMVEGAKSVCDGVGRDRVVRELIE